MILTEPKEFIKLRAEDNEDVSVLASLLQDALVPVIDMALFSDGSKKDNYQFVIVASRFCWEENAGSNQANSLKRVHTALFYNNVKKVEYIGFDRRNKDLVLSILTMQYRGNAVYVYFAGDAVIKIETDKLNCTVTDLFDPWPTKFFPIHYDSDERD